MNLQSKQRLNKILLKLKGNKSRRALAREIGVTATTIMGWENGVNEPDLQNLSKLAKCSGYSLQDFINHLEGKEKPVEISAMDSMIKEIRKMKLQQLAILESAMSERLMAIAESVG